MIWTGLVFLLSRDSPFWSMAGEVLRNLTQCCLTRVDGLVRLEKVPSERTVELSDNVPGRRELPKLKAETRVAFTEQTGLARRDEEDTWISRMPPSRVALYIQIGSCHLGGVFSIN